MRATETTYPPYVRHHRAEIRRILPKKSLLKRLRYLVVSTNWDEELIAQDKWINRICMAIIIFSILYFAPIVISTLTYIPAVAVR